MSNKSLTTLALLALSVGAFAADPSLFEIDGFMQNKYKQVNINYNGQNMNVIAGAAKARLDGGSFFDAYCVDLDHWNAPQASYPVHIRSTATLQNGGRAAFLYNQFAGTVSSSTEGAALQLAIWDVVTDNGDGFASGAFKSGVSGSVLAKAQQYLSQSAGQVSFTQWFEAISHAKTKNDKNQNYMGPVPEPATLAVIGIGLAGVLRRRRKK